MDKMLALHRALLSKNVSRNIIYNILSYVPCVICECGNDYMICEQCNHEGSECQKHISYHTCASCSLKFLDVCCLPKILSKLGSDQPTRFCLECIEILCNKCKGCGKYYEKLTYDVCYLHDVSICGKCGIKHNHMYNNYNSTCSCPNFVLQPKKKLNNP